MPLWRLPVAASAAGTPSRSRYLRGTEMKIRDQRPGGKLSRAILVAGELRQQRERHPRVATRHQMSRPGQGSLFLLSTIRSNVRNLFPTKLGSELLIRVTAL